MSVMDSTIRDFLPSPIPTGEIETTESFRLEKVQVTEDSVDYKKEYELSKAPVIEVRSVTGIVNGSETRLEKGEDYTVNSSQSIEFISSSYPDIGTEFDVTYLSESLISRYIDSVEDETDDVVSNIGLGEGDDDVDGIVGAKYISTADDKDLERIGELFGDLGKRAGRETERYRQYLQSIAKVYTGTGRKSNIAEATSVVVSDEDTTVSPDTIDFIEYFDDQEFSIIINNFSDHRVDLLYDVIDLADPSGVRLRSPLYQVNREYDGFLEGPNPDITRLDGIDSIDELESDFISPFNHKSPDRGEYPSKVSVVDDRDVFSSSITKSFAKPITFHWAEKIFDTGEFQNNASWNAVEWNEDLYSGVTNSGVTFTGVDWENADWNKFPYTDLGVVGADSIQTSETVEDRLFDRKIDESVVSDRGPILLDISFDKTDNISSFDNNSSDVTHSLGDEVAPAKFNSKENDWTSISWNTVKWSGRHNINIVSSDVRNQNSDKSFVDDDILPEIIFNKNDNTRIDEENSFNVTFNLNDNTASDKYKWSNIEWDTVTWSNNSSSNDLSLDIVDNSFDDVSADDVVLSNVVSIAWNSDDWDSLGWNGSPGELYI